MTTEDRRCEPSQAPVNTNGLPVPHIRCPIGTPIAVRFGWIGKAFIIAVAASLVTSGVSSYRVAAGEENDKDLERKLQTINRNIRKLDERQRINQARTQELLEGLDKLLELNGVTERGRKPPIPNSDMENIE